MKRALAFVANYFKPQKAQGAVYKNGPGDIIFHIINITVLLTFTVICILPFYFLFVNTISNEEYVARNMVTFWPRGFTLRNYFMLRDVGGFFQSLGVTIARTVIGTALMVLLSSFAGYLFSKRTMWKRKLWYRLAIITMYFNAGLIPWFLTMMNLGLTDNFLGYIVPMMIAPFNIILVKTYVESIPKDIEESAEIDGAGILTIFLKIILPLSIPILATIAIFGAVAHWNSLQDSLILMQNSPNLFVLQHRLHIYLTQAGELTQIIAEANPNRVIRDVRIIQYTLAMASAIPIVLVYPLMQRFFIKGMMIGAVKG